MYEHPIKRFGLSMNRIVLSNTRMVAEGFPKMTAAQYNVHFRFRTFSQGKTTQTRSK